MAEAENDIGKLREKNDSLTRELLRVYEELDLLHTLSSIFAASSDVDEMGARLVDEAVDALGGTVAYVEQTRPLGSGHALQQARDSLQGVDNVAVLHDLAGGLAASRQLNGIDSQVHDPPFVKAAALQDSLGGGFGQVPYPACGPFATWARRPSDRTSPGTSRG